MMQTKMLNFQDLGIKSTNQLKAQLHTDPQLLRAATEILNSSSKDTSNSKQDHYQKLLGTLRTEFKEFEASANGHLFGKQRPPQGNRPSGTYRAITPPHRGERGPDHRHLNQWPGTTAPVTNTGNKSPANKRWKLPRTGENLVAYSNHNLLHPRTHNGRSSCNSKNSNGPRLSSVRDPHKPVRFSRNKISRPGNRYWLKFIHDNSEWL